MFFFLSKLLAFLITPAVWVALLLLLALFARGPRWKKRGLVWGLIVYLLFSNPFLFNEAMHAWEFPAVAITEVEAHDVGILLGGYSDYDSTIDRMELGPNADRLTATIQLYHQKKIRKILISGGTGRMTEVSKMEADVSREYLLSIGIPDKDILVENESRNTHENALFSKEILDKELPGANCLLVTSGYHMTRAQACFEKVGQQVTPYSVDRHSGPRKFYLDHILLPHPEALLTWKHLIKEWVGYLTYRLVGYV